MVTRNLKNYALTAVAIVAVSTALADVAQEPLLNRPKTVAPNLALVMDTSGSMDANYIYQYGRIDTSGMGPQGPEPTSGTDYGSMSPDVNRIYYDPRVRYLPRVDYLGNPLTPDPPTTKDTGWRVYIRNTTMAPTTACPSGAYTTGQLVDISCYYNTSYTPPASAVVPGSTATYPNRIRSSTSASIVFPKFLNRTDCVASSTSCSLTEEGQNYSNWRKWYSTRGLMATTGIGHAFQDLKNDSIRLGYTTIGYINNNSRLYSGVSSFSCIKSPATTCSYATSSGTSKDNFYTWLYGLSFSGGTPNKYAVYRVGQYFERTDSDGPWSTLPDPTSTGITTVTTPSGPGKAELPADHASCRRSFSMLVTDGYTNGGGPTLSPANFDSTVISIPNAVGTTTYRQPLTGTTAAAPYKDASSNTMADIAMYYWGRDLRTLANRVPKISTLTVDNPSTWQNVSFYAVTLGIDGTLPRTTTTLANLKNGTTPWPAPTDNDPTTIDDLWHATINARGEMLNANNNTELTNGLKRMFESIAGTPQTLSGVAVSTTFLKSGTRKYKPEYVPGSWTGKLSAIELDSTTGNDKVPTNVYWQVESGVDPNTQDPVSLIPDVATRQSKVFTWNGSSGTLFNTASSGLSSDLVNYVMGDASKEVRKGGAYRTRTAKLGDIVNSSPAYIHDNIDLNYEKLVGSYGDYRAFVTSKIARPEGVLFVGANDGMLHGFRDTTGAEVFAFIPKAVIPKLTKLTETPYTHQYYVDGPNTETDAYLDSTWKNILLGTTGAGAQAVYAMDVTAPTAMTASSVMWEVNSSTSGFGNLGYIFSDVQAGVVEAPGTLANDNWVAIFGNGVGSSSGVASLFVVNLKTGALLKEIVVDSSGSNGLGGVRVVRDATQRIVGAYAGDLKGNLWKFDLTGSNKSNWKIGLGGSPLYAAGSSQSITATPAIVPHPSGGYVVNFGTGKFYETSDTVAPFVTQQLYGVWDKQAFGATSTPAGASLSGTASLQAQTIGSTIVNGTTYYTVSTNAVNWGDGLSSGQRGWYMALPNSGQRVAYPIERLFEKSSSTFILVSTISPVSSASEDQCVQTGSGSGWVYIIDGVTGSGSIKPTLDTNGDGKVDSADVVVSGYQDQVDGRPTPIEISNGGVGGDDIGCIESAQSTCTQFKLQCGQPGMPACKCVTNCGGGGTAPTIKKREWRQLFMR